LSAPAPAPVAAPRPPATVSPAWRQALAAWLSAHKTYPEAARRDGAEGGVVLRFSVDRSGHVHDVALIRGSGTGILDAAAESLLRGATLPAFSEGMTQDSVTVTVQIQYSLTE